MNNEKPKLYKISQWNNQISFQDITNDCEEDKLNKTLEKVKIILKKMKKKTIKLFMKYQIYTKIGILKEI